MTLAPSAFVYCARLIVTPALFLFAMYNIDTCVSFLESIFNLFFVHIIIYLYSTAVERAIIAAIVIIGLSCLLLIVRYSLPPRLQALANLIAVGVPASVLISYMHHWTLGWIGWFVASLLVVSGASAAAWERAFDDPARGRVVTSVFGAGIGVTEFFLPRPFLLWIRRGLGVKCQRRPEAPWRVLARHAGGIGIATLIFVLLLPYGKLAEIGQRLLVSKQVERFYGKGFSLHSPYDIASVQYDPPTRRLFLCGNGVNTARVVDTSDLSLPPVDTGIPTGGKNFGGQFCALDVGRRRIYATKRNPNSLIIADADSYMIKTSVDLGQMPAGEIFLALNDESGSIVVASEATSLAADDLPVRVIDLATQEQVYALGVAPGFMAVHPERPRMYVSFFWRETGIRAYDLESGELLASASSDPRADRVIVDPKRNELLVTSPLNARILVYDAETLAPKDPIPTVFGVRSLQIDARRDLLLAASLLSNEVELIELHTRRSKGRFRLGPWLRDIALDEVRGIAFVSSRHGVYAVQYADPAMPLPN